MDPHEISLNALVWFINYTDTDVRMGVVTTIIDGGTYKIVTSNGGTFELSHGALFLEKKRAVRFLQSFIHTNQRATLDTLRIISDRVESLETHLTHSDIALKWKLKALFRQQPSVK